MGWTLSFWDTLVAARRRWYVVVAGLLATMFALHAIGSSAAVYYSRTQVLFMAPTSQLYPNKLQTSSMDLIITAGIVGKRINGTKAPPKTASPDATMVGRGIRDGVLISLPDHGGQWSPNYDTRALDVEVAAATPEEMRARQRAAFAEISRELVALQDEQHVEEGQRITVQPAPTNPTVRFLSGEPRRAQLMTLVLGMALTLMTVAVVDLYALRRRPRREGRAPATGTHPHADGIGSTGGSPASLSRAGGPPTRPTRSPVDAGQRPH